MKHKILCLVVIAVFSLAHILHSQCSGGTNGGALNPVPATVYQTMPVTGGDYYTFTVPAGCFPTYDFSFCATDGGSAAFDTQLTILDGTGAYAGGFNDDFCGLQSHITWTPTTGGTYRILLNEYSCSNSGGAATLAYRAVTPSNMSYGSSTTVQASVAGITKCDFGQVIICIQVVTSGSCSPLSLTQFQFGSGSSTNVTLADASYIHIYYTGTTNTYSASGEFVTGGTAVAGGTNTINGFQALSAGTNYFWLAYDVNPGGTTGNLLDASCTQITVNGVNHTPTVTSPAGTRTISACTSYPGTSALGLKHWVKSNAGVTGNPVSAWADQSGAGVTGSLIQATVSSQPSVQSGLINFEDYLRFNGTSSILTSANSFTGASLFGATDNTILTVKNLKGGTVDYKWETAVVGPYRIGEENNSGVQRIDFVNNTSGNNSISGTTILNADVITEYLSNSNTLALKLNGNVDATIAHSLTFAPGAATSSLNLGGNGADNPLFCQVDLAEEMTFNKALSEAELRRVESYLSLKYGITLGNNQAGGAAIAYMESDGTIIWNQQTGYHNYVIGLGRDNAAGNSGLNKLKTTSVSSLNGSTDILILANGSVSAPAALTNDKSFLLTGNNAGTLATPLWLGANHAGPVTTIGAMTARIWAVQKTGTFAGNVIMEFDMSQVNGPAGYGTNANADIRLLIDDNLNFIDGSAGEYTISPTAGYATTGGKIDFAVPYSDLPAGTSYFALGSVNESTGPLPVHFTDIQVNCEASAARVQWTTGSETNNHFYTVERASESKGFVGIGSLPGAGNSSSSIHYTWYDEHPETGISYYRIRQTDYNGQFGFSAAVVLQSCLPLQAALYPNPFFGSTTLFIETKADDSVSWQVFDMTGHRIKTSKSEEVIREGLTEICIDLTAYASGVYILKLDLNSVVRTYKLVKN